MKHDLRFVKNAQRRVDTLLAQAVTLVDQFDAVYRDHVADLIRQIAEEGAESARDKMGPALFDAVARAMACKLFADASIKAIADMGDELEAMK